MAIVSILADLSKGADPSPWTLNGDDLYTDSTSYLVGIGTTDPDAYLHVKAINNTIGLKLQQVGSGITYKFAEFKNDLATTETFGPYISSDVTAGHTRVRFKSSGGGLTQWMFDGILGARAGVDLDGSSSDIKTTGAFLRVQASTGFGMGASSFTPSGAMLHVKDASNPQLKLDDASNFTTFKQSGTDFLINTDGGTNDNFEIESSTGKFYLKSNAGANRTIILNANNDWSSFGYLGVTTILEAATLKAGSFVSAPNGLILDYGLRFANTSKTANYTMLASDHVVFCDPPAGTPSMTITLPASISGRVVKIVDNSGNCSASNQIRVSPASGTINGSANVDINTAFGSVFAICDGTNWTITN